jgi:hypothetical protein
MIGARGALLATLVAALQTASAEPCAPRAHLDGDAEAVARVTAALAALGITVVRGGGDGVRDEGDVRCPAVVAAVELDRGGGIAVAVRDHTNRSEGRVLSDAALAAAWIDSWIHDDFAPEVPASPPSRAPGMVTAVATPVPATPVAAPTPADRFAVAAGYLHTFSFDGSGGDGFAGGACMRAGELCIGAHVAYSQLDVQNATRDDLMMTATASWSRSAGSMRISPELGAGIGRMTTDACPAPPPCDPMTMMCPMQPPCDQVGLHQTSYTPRLTGALRVAVPLLPHIWLDGTAAVVLAPFGHGDPFLGTMPDPSGAMGTIAGEPDAAAQLSIGVRVGEP